MDQKDHSEVVSQRELKKVSLSYQQDAKPVCQKDDANLSSADAKLFSEKHMKKLVFEPESSIAGVHALVVDDSLLDRKIVERLVKNASCRVTAVEGGAKALEILASANNNINLIVTDFCMPEMSGYDLLRHVKDDPSLKGIPVVIMSSENVPSRIRSCLDHGAEDFILKPLKLDDVKRIKSYVWRSQSNLLDHQSAPFKKRKIGQEGFQAKSPERGPRLGRVTVA